MGASWQEIYFQVKKWSHKNLGTFRGTPWVHILIWSLTNCEKLAKSGVDSNMHLRGLLYGLNGNICKTVVPRMKYRRCPQKQNLELVVVVIKVTLRCFKILTF